MWKDKIDVDVLLGKTLVRINGIDNSDVYFTTSDGERYHMYHDRDCCESVEIEDIEGDINDLIGSPLTLAECVSDYEGEKPSEYSESYTWTFYRFATVKGYVTIRWLGESNGYYSESVDFEKC